MHPRCVLFVLAALAASALAAPSNHASHDEDNAYPAANNYNASTTTPCATPTPTKTPCPEDEYVPDYKPTGTPQGAGGSGDVRPLAQAKCPAPITMTKEITRTLPPLTNTVTATKTLHDVRTVTTTCTQTATSTVVKPVVEYKTVVKPVTKTTTCHVTTTVKEYVTRVKREVDTTVVTKYATVTKTVGALPTGTSKAPCPKSGAVKSESDSAYGDVKPYTPVKDEPAYGPVKPHGTDHAGNSKYTGADDFQDDEDEYEPAPYMGGGSPDSDSQNDYYG